MFEQLKHKATPWKGLPLMKKPLALILAALILSGSMLSSCFNEDTPSDTDQIEETTAPEKEDEETTDDVDDDTTAEEVTDADTTAPVTTKVPETSNTTAQTTAQQTQEQNQGQSGSGSGGGSLALGGSAQQGGSSSQSGQSQSSQNSGGTNGWDIVVPKAASTKDAYPAVLITKSGKKLVHTYSDRAVGSEDNSQNLSYMPMLGSHGDPNEKYNNHRVLLKDLKPGLVSDGVIVGYDGYMFYNDTLADFSGQGFLHGEIYDRTVKMLKERNKWAEDHGKKFYFVIAPNKNTVYPDYMPDGYSIASYRRYDQFVEILRSAGITAVDLRDTMKAAVNATPERNLYYKYDTHWNNHAGFLAYQTTMNMIRKDFPNAVLHQKSDYQINYCETYMKDQAYYLGYYDYFKDYGPVYTLKNGKSATLTRYTPKDAWGQFAFAYECTSGPNKGFSDKLYELQYTNDSLTSAPNAYVMRDSYSIAMIPFLKDSFHSSTYNWTFDFSTNEIEKAKADIILVIVAERNLKSYVNAVPVKD